MTDQRQSHFKYRTKHAFWAATAHAHWFALALLLAVGLFSLWNTSRLIASNQAETQLRKLLNQLKETIFTVDDAETGQRGYLLVGDESYLEPYRQSLAAIDPQMERVGLLMKAVPGQQATFETLKQVIAQKIAELKTTIELRQSAGIEAAMQVVRSGRGKDLMNDIRGLVNQINDESQELLASHDRQIVSLSKRATVWGVVGNALAAVLFVAVLRRDCRKHEKVVSRAREMVRSVEASRQETIKQSDLDIEALGQQARDLAVVVETSRKETLMQTEEKIDAIGQQAVELARSVETLRIQAVAQADETIESVYQQPRDMAVEIEALGQQARDLARSVESSRIQTLHQSDEKIEALGQQARDLARAVEMSRLQTLKQSDKEIEALGQQARDLATFVESSRMQTLMQSDDKIDRGARATSTRSGDVGGIGATPDADEVRQGDRGAGTTGARSGEDCRNVATTDPQAIG